MNEYGWVPMKCWDLKFVQFSQGMNYDSPFGFSSQTFKNVKNHLYSQIVQDGLGIRGRICPVGPDLLAPALYQYFLPF